MARRTAIGLDIGTSVVRAAEVSVGSAGMTLERLGQVVLPEGAVRDGEVADQPAVVRAIRQLWDGTGFGHKRVVLGVANQRVIVRPDELPWLPRAELRASLPFQVADRLPFPVETAVLDFFPVEEFTGEAGARFLRGMLVAASRETVLANVRCAEKAGLKPQSVDLTAFAVLRALGARSTYEVGTEALIDVGARITNLVVHSGGQPRFVRILLMGGQDVTDAVSERLGVPAAEAEGLKQRLVSAASLEDGLAADRAVESTAADFVEEVRNSLDYYAALNPANPIERIVVSGGGSRLEGMLDRLAGHSRVPVLTGDPFAGLSLGDTGLDEAQLDFVRPLAAVPVGLALGGVR